MQLTFLFLVAANSHEIAKYFLAIDLDFEKHKN